MLALTGQVSAKVLMSHGAGPGKFLQSALLPFAFRSGPW